MESQAAYGSGSGTAGASAPAQQPTPGRIVLVRPWNAPDASPEWPAIVVTVHGPECISVQAFRPDRDGAQLVTSLLPQTREGGQGWRWPPRS